MLVLRDRGRVDAVISLCAEYHLEGIRLDAIVGDGGIDEERIERFGRGIAHLQLDVLELDARLDRVLAMPAEVGERDVVLDGVAALRREEVAKGVDAVDLQDDVETRALRVPRATYRFPGSLLAFDGVSSVSS